MTSFQVYIDLALSLCHLPLPVPLHHITSASRQSITVNAAELCDLCDLSPFVICDPCAALAISLPSFHKVFHCGYAGYPFGCPVPYWNTERTIELSGGSTQCLLCIRSDPVKICTHHLDVGTRPGAGRKCRWVPVPNLCYSLYSWWVEYMSILLTHDTYEGSYLVNNWWISKDLALTFTDIW